ncbi:MAG: alpha/beta hydrolase [Ignavibacteriae bacterium]|nr:MAG: alpha/beta hydrolase [Ignavibacteriota bacterium]
MKKNYTYTTEENYPIDITTYGNIENENCIIFVHGFKGFKDWGFGPYIGEYLSNKNFFVITFNFSHNGVGKDSVDFDELDKFAENTYSKEISELEEIIAAYKSGFFGKIDSDKKIGLLGHSRGGGVAIVTASKNNNISAFVTWASIANFDRFSQRQKEDWKEKGYLEMLNSRTKQLMRMNKTFLDDLLENKSDTLNIEKAVRNLQIPYLLVHGEQDLAVSIKEAENIYYWSNKEKTELFKVKGTGHTFDIKHPFEGASKVLNKVLEKTSDFFDKNLNKIK